MIVGVEGLSKSGKTTFINMFIEKYPETIRFRGAGAVNVGIQSRWQEYNFWMHNIIEQLDKLNNSKNIILWDRFLSDAIHSKDPLYSSEILRAMKSHSNKCVIYIDIDKNVLERRGTKEGSELYRHNLKYKETIKSFDTLRIRPGIDIPDSELDTSAWNIKEEHIATAYEFIKSKMKI